MREGRRAVAATPRDRGERVQGFGLALRVAFLVQEARGAAQELFRHLEATAQARDFGAVEESARVRLDRFGGQAVHEMYERRERAAREPLPAARGDERGGPLELAGFGQVVYRLLPLASLREVVCEAEVFGGDARLPDLGAQASAQEAAQERVQPVLFAALVTRYGHEDVAAHERGQQRRAAGLRIDRRAGVRLDAFEERDAQE